MAMGNPGTYQWATKYRPRNFEEVKGQREKVHLRAMLRQGDGFPPLLIFRGPSGTGKTTIARIVAAALNCENLGDKGDPCGVCAPCETIVEGNFPGVYEHNAALRNGAEDMRQIQERAYLQSVGTHSVFILDEAQTLSSQAWKVLLKLFEEPPAGCVFILVTSEPNKIPRTIQTRALTYEFGKVDPASITEAVKHVLAEESESIHGLELVVDLANGSVREAITLAEQCVRSGGDAFDTFGTRDTSLQVIEAATDNDIAKGLVSIEAMWRGAENAEYIAERLADTMQNVTYLAYGLPVYVSPETNVRLKAVADKLGTNRISNVLTIMSEWNPRIRTKAHLLFMWQDILKVLHGVTKPQAIVQPVHRTKDEPTIELEDAPETNVAMSPDQVADALKGMKF